MSAEIGPSGGQVVTGAHDVVVAFAGTAACHHAGYPDLVSDEDVAGAQAAVAGTTDPIRALESGEREAAALIEAEWMVVRDVAERLYRNGWVSEADVVSVARSHGRTLPHKQREAL